MDSLTNRHFARKGIVVPVLAAAVHFVLCLAMADYLGRPHGESWGWFPIFLLDFPMSILVLKFFQEHPPLLTYGVLGSLWWALVAYSAVRLVTRLRS